MDIAHLGHTVVIINKHSNWEDVTQAIDTDDRK